MQNLIHSAAQEGGNNCRRSFVCPQTVSVRSRCDGCLEQTVVPLHGIKRVYEESDELQISESVLAGSHKIDSGIGAQTPVVVLAASVHAGKGLFVQKHHESMPACHPVHHIHYLLVLVVGQIHLPIDRSKLKLVRSNFLVPGFQRNAEFVSFHLQFFHKCGNTRRNSAEIVVVQLLVLAGFVSHQRASGNHQIRAGGIDILIYKEILLLPSEIGTYMLYGRIEEAADRQSGISYSLQ